MTLYVCLFHNHNNFLTKMGDSCSNIKEKADAARLKLIPNKSAGRYRKELELFKHWEQTNGVVEISEDVILAYVSELSEKFESSSVWTKISMLKKMLLTHENVDISSYEIVKSFMKTNSSGYSPKQSRTFTRDQINTFLKDASDDYLALKVAVIFGIFGACRREELYNVSVNDIVDTGSSIIVTVPKTKTGQRRMFSIIDDKDDIDYLGKVRKYIDMRPKNISHDHFFVSCRKDKCTVQRIGINTFGDMGKKVAVFLKLPEPTLYTGHAFRRSSATLLADSGADLALLKRHGSWKSTSVAERYVEDSLASKNKIARMIHGTDTNTTNPLLKNVNFGQSSMGTVSSGGIRFENMQNCTINVTMSDKSNVEENNIL